MVREVHDHSITTRPCGGALCIFSTPKMCFMFMTNNAAEKC